MNRQMIDQMREAVDLASGEPQTVKLPVKFWCAEIGAVSPGEYQRAMDEYASDLDRKLGYFCQFDGGIELFEFTSHTYKSISCTEAEIVVLPTEYGKILQSMLDAGAAVYLHVVFRGDATGAQYTNVEILGLRAYVGGMK